jgi:hypothetical protein
VRAFELILRAGLEAVRAGGEKTNAVAIKLGLQARGYGEWNDGRRDASSADDGPHNKLWDSLAGSQYERPDGILAHGARNEAKGIHLETLRLSRLRDGFFPAIQMRDP